MSAHVLVVEDEAPARYSLVQILTRAGYRVTEAPHGEAALDLLQREPFALIVADIRMGMVDGLQVLQASQQLAEPPAVILLTGYGSLETSLTALRTGVADYLLKPVEPEQLLTSVAGALERRAEMLYNREAARILSEGLATLQRRSTGQPAPPPKGFAFGASDNSDQLIIGELQIGRHRHAVQYRGQPVALTQTEYAILRCLVEANDEVLHYEALAQCAYGYAVASAEAQVLLKAHVRNLRQKLAPDVIATVRGVGYRLEGR
ncbi:MAG: response regulator transcription factor [Blastochloris sp.]|nr:response regulator transcription factor [Blastochloris sp.]